MLFTGDDPDKTRELLKFLWVRVWVFGEALYSRGEGEMRNEGNREWVPQVG